jgi:integrase
MPTELTRRPVHGELSTELANLAKKAADFASRSKSANTRRAYRSDWGVFCRWCIAHGLAALPATPGTIAAFVTDMAGSKASTTIDRYCSTITKAHKVAGYDSPAKDPAVVEVLAGIRRTIGTRPKQKKAAVVAILRAMCAACPQDTMRGVRDRAVLLMCWAGAFRRSELISVQFTDVEFVEQGILVHIERSKTDQEARGASVAIPYGSDPSTCPVRSLKRWLEKSGIDDGALFRPLRCGAPTHARTAANDGGKLVARIVKRAAKQAGFDPSVFGGHSLRAGLATQAAMSGKPDRVIMDQGRWKDRRTLEKYIREGTAFRDNAASGIGL